MRNESHWRLKLKLCISFNNQGVDWAREKWRLNKWCIIPREPSFASWGQSQQGRQYLSRSEGMLLDCHSHHALAFLETHIQFILLPIYFALNGSHLIYNIMHHYRPWGITLAQFQRQSSPTLQAYPCRCIIANVRCQSDHNWGRFFTMVCLVFSSCILSKFLTTNPNSIAGQRAPGERCQTLKSSSSFWVLPLFVHDSLRSSLCQWLLILPPFPLTISRPNTVGKVAQQRDQYALASWQYCISLSLSTFPSFPSWCLTLLLALLLIYLAYLPAKWKKRPNIPEIRRCHTPISRPMDCWALTRWTAETRTTANWNWHITNQTLIIS